MAKHYIGQTVTENPAYMQAKVRVPAAVTLVAGNIVVAEELDTTLKGNVDVYSPKQVANATKEDVAIILNNGFETLADGRRPDGQPDYTQYEYTNGEVITAHRLLPETRYRISIDACDDSVIVGTVKAGDNLIPKNGQYTLSYSAKGTAVTAKNYLTVEAIEYFQLGGQFGSEMVPCLIVRAKTTDATE